MRAVRGVPRLKLVPCPNVWREIGCFRNATAEEQLEWMHQTESKLQGLLDADGLDGDGLCWLHRPVLRI